MWEGPVDADQYDGFGHCDMPSSPCRSSLADGRNQGKSVIILIFYYGDFDFSFPFYQEKCMLYPCIHFFAQLQNLKYSLSLPPMYGNWTSLKSVKKYLLPSFCPKLHVCTVPTHVLSCFSLIERYLSLALIFRKRARNVVNHS